MTLPRLIVISGVDLGVHLLALGRTPGPVARFSFDGHTANVIGSAAGELAGGGPAFVAGVDGQALRLRAGAAPSHLNVGVKLAISGTQELHAIPGPTHRNGRRIDQLYYRGAGFTNASTRVISSRAAGFPSDHFMIVSTFGLTRSTPRAER